MAIKDRTRSLDADGNQTTYQEERVGSHGNVIGIMGRSGEYLDETYRETPKNVFRGRAPIGPPPGTDLAAATRRRQQELIDRLHGIASGSIKSPAQLLFEQNVQAARASNRGSASTLRDVGAGGQARAAAQGAEAIGMRGDQAFGQLRDSENSQIENLLVKLYGQQRGDDLTQASLDAETVVGNRGLNDARVTSDLGREVGINIRNANRQQTVGARLLGVQNTGVSDAAKLSSIAEGAGTAAAYFQQQAKAKDKSADLYNFDGTKG